MEALLKQNRWKWLKTLKRDELCALDLTDEERIQFRCPLKRMKCFVTLVRTGTTVLIDRPWH